MDADQKWCFQHIYSLLYRYRISNLGYATTHFFAFYTGFGCEAGWRKTENLHENNLEAGFALTTY